MLRAIGNFIFRVFNTVEQVGTEDFVPKKQTYTPHPSWMMPPSTLEDRQHWMNKHYNGETHPIDIPESGLVKALKGADEVHERVKARLTLIYGGKHV